MEKSKADRAFSPMGKDLFNVLNGDLLVREVYAR